MVPFVAALPAGNYIPRFRITNRGFFEGDAFTSGTIDAETIQVGTSPIETDLQFPSLVAVSGSARDSAGNELSQFRFVEFRSETAQIFSDDEDDFRVLLPVGRTYQVEIINRMIANCATCR